MSDIKHNALALDYPPTQTDHVQWICTFPRSAPFMSDGIICSRGRLEADFSPICRSLLGSPSLTDDDAIPKG